MIETFELNGNKIEYIIDYPANFNKNKKYPVMFYFHGYGIVGKGLNYLAENCPLKRERLPSDLEFILIKPLCKHQTWIKILETVVSFIESICKLPYCDAKKVYLSGSSMGGYTSWILLQIRRDLFTAAVICCGGGQYWAARIGAFNGVPIRAIHGRLDVTVFHRESELMAEIINENGGNCELIVYDDLGHDVWTRTFTDNNTYYWLNKFSKE